MIYYIIPVISAMIVGSFFVDKNYYRQIRLSTNLPTPPPILFGIIWTLIYLIFIFSFSIIPDYYYLFIITMILNALWTYVFFKLNQIKTAIAMIIIMIFLAIYTIFKLLENINTVDDKTTGLIFFILFLIYPIWLLIALYLTIITLSLKIRAV